MKRFLRGTCAAIMAIVLAVLMMAGPALAEVATEVHIVRVQQEEDDLFVYVTAMDSFGVAGTQTYNLKDYVLIMGDQSMEAAAAQNFRSTGGAVHYVVCVDVSGSIGSGAYDGVPEEKQAVQDALAAFVDSLGTNEAMTLITFGSSVDIAARVSGNRDELKNAIPTEFDQAYTQMYEAIYKGASLAYDNIAQYPNTALIIITDGSNEYNTDGGSQYDYSPTLQVLKDAYIPVYTLAFERPSEDVESPNHGPEYYAEQLGSCRDFAAATGGRVWTVGYKNLRERLVNLQEITRSAALVQVHLTNEKGLQQRENESLRISVNTGNRNLVSPDDYVFAVEWNEITPPTPVPTVPPTPSPTPDVKLDTLEFEGAVSEDSRAVTVRTEANAAVEIFLDDSQTAAFSEKADDKGYVTWDLEAEGTKLIKGQTLRLRATDTAGNQNDRAITLTVEESSREKISVNVNPAPDAGGTILSESITISGEASEGALIVSWGNDEFEVTADEGFYTFTLTPDMTETREGRIRVRYADGYSVSRNRTYERGVLTWDTQVDTTVDKPELDPVTEDSGVISGVAEPGSDVLVYIVRQNGERIDLTDGAQTADDSGLFSVTLVDTAEYLKKSDVIYVEVADTAGNTKSFPYPNLIGESDRAQITVSAESLEDGKLYEPTMLIRGQAESDVPLNVVWYLDEGGQKTAVFQDTTQATNGEYSLKISWQERLTGDGYVLVEYADHKGSGRSGSSSGGTFMWATATPAPTRNVATEPPATATPEATPEPTVPPTPEPTPVPTAVPTPSPEPTPEPFVHKVAGYFGGPDEMLHNPRFWFVAAAALLLLALIVVLIVVMAKRQKKKHPTLTPVDDDKERGTDYANVAGTVRRDMNGSGDVGSTKRRQQPASNIPVPLDADSDAPIFDNGGAPRPGGTLNINSSNSVSGASGTGTVRINQEPNASGTGTVRISRAEDQIKPLALHVQETRAYGVNNERNVYLTKELSIGRNDERDLVIRDETVSDLHAVIIRENDKVFITDKNSSNGTSVNGRPLTPGVREELHSGDAVLMGRTTMVIRFDI